MLADDELCGLQRMKHHGLRGSKASCGATTPFKDAVVGAMVCALDFGVVAKTRMNAAKSAVTPM
jgi:hypothetical protein